MKILVIGSGGREHSLVWKLTQSPKASKIYCAPGNAGIGELAECVPLKAMDLEGLLAFALNEKIDLTFVGPEAPLVAGIVDLFNEAGLRIIGPKGGAAQIEGSKTFAKELMVKYRIPTAQYQVFTDREAAKNYIMEIGVPIVVKMDGLAAGKGVVVARDFKTALQAVDDFLPITNPHRSRLLIEEFLEGEEITVMAFSDGKTIKPMVWAQDHKRVYEGDLGPNTGGMGAYSPTGLESNQLEDTIYQKILLPTIKAMAQEQQPFKGILYAGLILTESGPKVLEYNARFGDPECQVVLPRLETDLVEITESILSESLDSVKISWKKQAAVCVIMASGGYPGDFSTGYPIKGLGKMPSQTLVFQAGTAKQGDQVVTSGGRVLGITGLGQTLEEATNNAYSGIDQIRFADRHFRMDIGWRALQRGREST
ncbi:MAG: phosphoribosylamine--glycine ligase [Bacillota bacterium]